jgi:D-alanyl-D-alanine carboxypeptidase
LQLATEETAPAAPAEAAVEVAAAAPAAEPVPFQIVDNETLEVVQEANSDAEASEETVQMAALAPQARPAELVVAAAAAVAPNPTPIVTQPEVVTRVSTSGGRHWGINVGRFTSRYEAERVLLRVALNEMSTLDGSLRRVDQSSQGFDANFMGLTRETADLACRRLQARGTTCFMIGSEG